MTRNLVKILLGVLMSCCVFSGCTIYSETRNKQGQALKEAYSKVELKKQFEMPRTNRANILAQQLATIDALEAVRREGLVRAVATGRGPNNTVLAQLNMVSALSGADAILGAGVSGGTIAEQLATRKTRSAAFGEWTAYETQANDIRKYIANYVQPQFIFQRVGQPTCKDIQTGSAAKLAVDKWIADRNGTVPGVLLRNSLTILEQNCKALQAVLARQSATKIGGALAHVLQALADEETRFENLKKRTEAERTAVESELAKRDEAEERGDGKGVRDAAGRVQELLAKIKTAEDVFSIQFISDKEQDGLDEFLTTVKDTPTGGTPKAGSSKAAMALVLFPDLITATQKKLGETDKVSLAPLVMQKNISRIKHDAATRDIATRKLRIDLLTRQADLLRQQVVKLVEQDNVIAQMPAELLRMPMTEVLAAPGNADPANSKGHRPSIDQKMAVWTSLATYIDQGTRTGGEVAKTGLKLNALESEILLGYSEANVMQWDALIGSSVDQLATYGGAGIKAEQFTALINSVTLLWIGAGVN